MALRSSLEAGVRPAFPPSLVVQVKALACELPYTLGLPLSRLSVEEIRQHVISQGLVAEISGATLWRWLSSDALRPWKHRSWIFPRDPNFAAKAGPVLDLYQRVWEGAPLGADDYVICADEKTSIQARRRKQPTLPLAPNRPTYVEHEYFRMGAWTYLTHFLFRSLCNRLLKRILNRFQISGIWLQAHFEIIEDRLLVGFGCGDFLELHVAQHDFVAPDRCQALDHVAHCPLSIFVGAIGGE